MKDMMMAMESSGLFRPAGRTKSASANPYEMRKTSFFHAAMTGFPVYSPVAPDIV